MSRCEVEVVRATKVAAELDIWMHHCHGELREALEFGDHTEV